MKLYLYNDTDCYEIGRSVILLKSNEDALPMKNTVKYDDDCMYKSLLSFDNAVNLASS